jgi:polysaccharide export outer membrane protein
MAWALSSSGCVHTVPTISFDEFRAMQREMAPPEPGPAPTDPETGESRVERNLGPYRVGPGDVLSATLSGLDVAIVSPVSVLVHSDGAVTLPLAGEIQVEGKTLEEVEDTIRQAFVPAIVRDLAVRVAVEEYETTHVTVLGAVAMPGLVTLPRHQRNMLYAVLSAGGVTDAATGAAELRRIRRPAESVMVDLTNPVELEAALTLDPLQNGDMIVVGAAFPNTIFVGGLVNLPAPQAYPAAVEVNYLQVLAAAGGLRTDVRPRKGLLIRRMPNGQDVRVKLDLDRLADGLDENFLLASGDILWIPETDGTKLHEFFNRNFFFRAGVSVTYDPIQFEHTRRALRQNRDYGSGFSQSINDALRYGLQSAFFPAPGAQP